MRVMQVFEEVSRMPFVSVLDIGSGSGEYAKAFKEAGKIVTTVNLEPPADIIGDYAHADCPAVDCIWACHVLEHQRNPGLFLSKCLLDLKEDGILAVSVPPAKDEIVGGHLTLWNAGLLLYNLVMAGFDCSSAKVIHTHYNISVIVRKKLALFR